MRTFKRSLLRQVLYPIVSTSISHKDMDEAFAYCFERWGVRRGLERERETREDVDQLARYITSFIGRRDHQRGQKAASAERAPRRRTLSIYSKCSFAPRIDPCHLRAFVLATTQEPLEMGGWHSGSDVMRSPLFASLTCCCLKRRDWQVSASWRPAAVHYADK